MTGEAPVTVVETYRFTPDDLRVSDRRPGVSAFMRVRNGEDFLEPTIRSHAAVFDEIVVVYNQCTDRTEEILVGLKGELGDRLRLFHYLPRVHPPGSTGHAAEPADSPHSLVNYYNFALAQTRFSLATKLDDDHLALPADLAALVAEVRAGRHGPGRMVCFSGLNLARGPDAAPAVLLDDPISGGGDIGFFPVTPETYFVHDRRFERFRRVGLTRVFGRFVYLHAKYLKRGMGFDNYELDANPGSRYAARREAMSRGLRTASLADFIRAPAPRERLIMALRRAGIPLPEKLRLHADRRLRLASQFAGRDLADLIRESGFDPLLRPAG